MILDIQFKLINDSNLHQYIRENSHWYKTLNRNPESINLMIQEMKDKYKLNPSDRIEELGNKLSMINALLNIIK